MKVHDFLRAGCAFGATTLFAAGVAIAHDSSKGMMSRSDMHHGRGGGMMHGPAMVGGAVWLTVK